MADEFDPVQAGAVAVQEPAQFDPVASGAVPIEQPAEKSILRNIGEAALETVKGFIPKSALQVAEMATPAVSAIENVATTPRKLYDVAFGGKSVAEAFPETQTFVETEKTPPFSKERFAAGFGTLAQLGMAAAVGRGARLGEIVHGVPETPTPVADAAEAAQVMPETAPVVPEAPAATQSPTEPFPSILQSAEEQRRTAPQEAVQQPVGGEINASEVPKDEASYGQGVRQEEGAGGGSQNLEQAAQGNRPDSGAGPEVAPVPQPTAEIPPSSAAEPVSTVDTAPEPVRPPEVKSLTSDSLPDEVGPNVKGFDTAYGPGEIKSGESVNPDDLFRKGKADLAGGKDPYALAGRARTGDVSPREIGLLAAEHDRLLTEAANAEGTPEYPDKYQQAKDFAQNMLKPAGTKFHQLGMGLQIKAPVDFSNLTGFRQAFEERFNKEMTPAQAEAFGKMSKDIAAAKAEDSAELGRTADRVQQRFKGVKDISFEEAVKGMNDAIATALKNCNL